MLAENIIEIKKKYHNFYWGIITLHITILENKKIVIRIIQPNWTKVNNIFLFNFGW